MLDFGKSMPTRIRIRQNRHNNTHTTSSTLPSEIGVLTYLPCPPCPHYHHYSHHAAVLVYNLWLRTNFTLPVPLLFFEFRSSNSNKQQLLLRLLPDPHMVGWLTELTPPDCLINGRNSRTLDLSVVHPALLLQVSSEASSLLSFQLSSGLSHRCLQLALTGEEVLNRSRIINIASYWHKLVS